MQPSTGTVPARPWTAAATACGSAPAVGVKMTRIASAASASRTARPAAPIAAASAPAPRSIGLLVPATAGPAVRRRSWSPSDSRGTSRPAPSQASAARIAGPAELLITATRSPTGSGWLASSWPASSSSARVSARITPASSKRASVGASPAARAAVCDAAPRRPAPLRPDLQGHHRHLAGDHPRQAAEAARVAEALQVQQHRLGLRVGGPPGEQVVARDIGPVAEADRRGQRQAALGAPGHRRDPDPAALAGEPERAGPGDRRAGWAEGGVEAQRPRVHRQAEAVGPDHPKALRAGDVGELGLELAPLRTGLGEARGEDDQGPRAGRRRLAGGIRHARRRDRDHHQVRGGGQRGERRVGRLAVDRRRRRVDREDRAEEAASAKGAQDGAARGGRVARGAEDRDRLRGHQRSQRGRGGGGKAGRGRRLGRLRGGRDAHDQLAARSQQLRFAAEVAQQGDHRPVVGAHDRPQHVDLVAGRVGDQALDQASPDTEPVPAVVNGHGHLGLAVGRQPVVAGQPDRARRLLTCQGHQAEALWAGGAGHLRHLLGSQRPTDGAESHRQRRGRQASEELGHRRGVGRADHPDGHPPSIAGSERLLVAVLQPERPGDLAPRPE